MEQKEAKSAKEFGVIPVEIVCHVHVFVDMRFTGETLPRGRGNGTQLYLPGINTKDSMPLLSP